MSRLLSSGSSRPPLVPLLALATVIAFAVTACSTNPGDVTSPAPVAPSVSSAPAEQTPTDTPSAAVAQTYPVGKTCDDLISLQALYDFNPNYSLDASQRADAGSTAEKLTAIQGVACTYVNLSSGNKIVLAIAKLDSKGLANAQSVLTSQGAAKASSVTPPVVASYFQASGGVGTQDLFTGTYWVSVSSSSFLTPEDTLHFLDPVMTGLS